MLRRVKLCGTHGREYLDKLNRHNSNNSILKTSKHNYNNSILKLDKLNRHNSNNSILKTSKHNYNNSILKTSKHNYNNSILKTSNSFTLSFRFSLILLESLFSLKQGLFQSITIMTQFSRLQIIIQDTS